MKTSQIIRTLQIKTNNRMTSNYNEILIELNVENRDRHIAFLEKKFKVGSKFTPEHFKSVIGGRSSINPIKFIDATIVKVYFYMGFWLKVTADYQEWNSEAGIEDKVEKWHHFKTHYNPMTGKIQADPFNVSNKEIIEHCKF